MFGGIALCASVCAYATTETSNVFDEERERSQSNILRGECHQYLAERDKMQVQTVVL